jgi:hypothetical protein
MFPSCSQVQEPNNTESAISNEMAATTASSDVKDRIRTALVRAGRSNRELIPPLLGNWQGHP